MGKATWWSLAGLLLVILYGCSKPSGDAQWISRLSPAGTFSLSVPERFVPFDDDRPAAVAQLRTELGPDFDAALDMYSEVGIPTDSFFGLDKLSSVPGFVNSLLVVPGEPLGFLPSADSVVQALSSVGYRGVEAQIVESEGRTILITHYETDFSDDRGLTIPIAISQATCTVGRRSFTVIVTSSVLDSFDLAGVAASVAESIQDRSVP